MFHALKGNLRILSVNGFIRPAGRGVCALLLTLLLSVAASAYTVVLRSGRRINIPSDFIVTSLTLTYEAAPGLNVTLLMSTIDISATERANNEAAGALLKRAEMMKENVTASTGVRTKRRPLTQADIEKARIERQKSEQAYERRRVELGLPSLEESRRRQEEETKRLLEESQKNQAGVAQSESYWRERASELRAEMASLDAEINYTRARLAESPDYSALQSYTFLTGASPNFFPRHVTTRFPVVTGNPGFMRGLNNSGGQGAGFLAFGGAQAGIQFGGGLRRGNPRRPLRVSPGIIISTPGLYGVPNPNYDYSQERSDLISRLHALESARAGLTARWHLLEEEARRAGAQPGWLRP